jgi:sugar phosphate isomerase/epimerase
VSKTKLSIQENLVPARTFAEKLCIIEEFGFEAVEIWGNTPPADWNKYAAHPVPEKMFTIKSALSSSKIKVSTICSYPGQLLAAEPKDRDRAMKAVEERIRLCSDLGGIGVITVPVYGPPKISDTKDIIESEYQILVEEYSILAKHAENYGVNILLEPINRYETHLINTIEQALRVHSAVNNDHMKIMADFFHMNIEEKNIPQSLVKASGKLGHMHLADSDRSLPGAGHTDFASAFRALKSCGFDKFLTIESNVPENPLVELPKTVKFLQKFFI